MIIVLYISWAGVSDLVETPPAVHLSRVALYPLFICSSARGGYPPPFTHTPLSTPAPNFNSTTCPAKLFPPNNNHNADSLLALLGRVIQSRRP